MNILILGWYGHHNCGDESYKIAFPKVFPNHNFTFSENLNDLNNQDLIILGGGNVLKTGFLNQLKKSNLPKISISTGIESLDLQELKVFKHIFCRDLFTLKSLQNIVPCSFIPDLAFSLTAERQRGDLLIEKMFKSENKDLYSKKIVIIINSFLIHGSQNAHPKDAFNFLKFSYELARVIDEVPASFIFLPFGTGMPWDDRISNAWVAFKCKYWKKNVIMFDNCNIQNSLDIIASADLVVSSRLHSSIFSYSCGTPFVDITHHTKNKHFLETYDIEDNSISFWNFDGSYCKNKIIEKMEEPKHGKGEEVRNRLKEIASEIHFDRYL